MCRKTDQAGDTGAQDGTIVYSVVDFFDGLAKWNLLLLLLFVGE